MRQITPNEMLSISKLLEIETNNYAVAKAGINVIQDQELKTKTQAGMVAMEARIKGLQQFINDNNICMAANVPQMQPGCNIQGGCQ